MKLKKQKPKTSNHMSSGEDKSTDNSLPCQSFNLGLVDVGSNVTSKKHKRKACPSQEKEYGCSEELQPKQKHESKKIKRDKKITPAMQFENELPQESDAEDKKQDNTPESLKKQKKIKKKKKNKVPVNSIGLNDQPNTAPLEYLRRWKNDRSHWKFEKVKQIRLISNMFDSGKLPDDDFSIFLEYMEKGSKSMQEFTSRLANEVISEMEKWESLSDSEKETVPKVDENKYKRARTLLQMLQ